MLKYLSLHGNLHKAKTMESLEGVLDGYNLIALTERMPESLVVFSMLTQVPLADVITLSAKTTGGWDDGASRNGCTRIQRKTSTPRVDEYVKNDFVAQHKLDYILYAAANRSLDLTIDLLGRDTVERRVVEYKALLTKNSDACHDTAIFPCPITLPNHTARSRADCYYNDAGCGHRCTDEALRAESEAEWALLYPESKQRKNNGGTNNVVAP